MTQPAFEHTTMGRTYEALHEWWEREHRRGVWNARGQPWEAHPTWSTVADREQWHQNWGELLNNHTTAHIRTVLSNGITHLRLRVRVTHPETSRLELVKSVTGGAIERPDGPRTVCRLEIENMAAFQALKAGRLYVDPVNFGLIEVLDAAMSFYRHVPEPGQSASDEQRVAQEYWRDKLDELNRVYVTGARPAHDCAAGIRRAGTANWHEDPAAPSPYRLFV